MTKEVTPAKSIVNKWVAGVTGDSSTRVTCMLPGWTATLNDAPVNVSHLGTAVNVPRVGAPPAIPCAAGTCGKTITTEIRRFTGSVPVFGRDNTPKRPLGRLSNHDESKFNRAPSLR